MKTNISFEIDTEQLSSFTDSHLASLWHIAQANPAPFGNAEACQVAEYIGREIIRRFVEASPPELWVHQMSHVALGKTLSAGAEHIPQNTRTPTDADPKGQ